MIIEQILIITYLTVSRINIVRTEKTIHQEEYRHKKTIVKRSIYCCFVYIEYLALTAESRIFAE